MPRSLRGSKNACGAARSAEQKRSNCTLLPVTQAPVTRSHTFTVRIRSLPRRTEPLRASIADLILEGLCALKKISRSDEGRLFGTPSAPRPRQEARQPETLLDDEPAVKGKKKYYN